MVTIRSILQDVLARYEAKHSDWTKLPEKAVFQLNDTHPTIAVPELMRLLIDQKVTTLKCAVLNALLSLRRHDEMQPIGHCLGQRQPTSETLFNHFLMHRVWTGTRRGR
jgi:Carbohydrate phosphorylase